VKEAAKLAAEIEAKTMKEFSDILEVNVIVEPTRGKDENSQTMDQYINGS